MAPAASTMKKPAAAATTLKRPAKGILKRPAAQSTKKRKEMEDKEEGEGEEEEPLEDDEEILPKLTSKALQDHERFCVEAKDLNEESFVKALAKLKPEAAQRLWKKFQNSRKAEGAEDEYQETLTGKSAGSLHKKRKLLLGWIQPGKTCGEIYRGYMTKVTFTKTSGEKEKWLTTTQALQCWGKDELWKRVQSGTIKARRNPEDKRFWEFRNNQQVGKTEVARAKASSVTFSGKADKEVALEFDRQDWSDLVEDDWDGQGLEEGGEEDGEEEKDLAKLLGVKLPKEPQDKQKKNKEDEWELASKIKDADTQDEISDKVMKS